jgi:hypothetical protein
VVVTPPSGIGDLTRYMTLMEAKGGNRYIDLPGAGAFANIYLLRKNYYFDCYRVPPEAFALLMENLLIPGGQGRLTGQAFAGANLKISFKNKEGQLVREHLQPLQLHNVMVFASLAGLKRSPYAKGKEKEKEKEKGGQLDEQRHALFILPCLGSLERDDYALIESETGSITLKLSPQDLKLIDRADCALEMKR